MRASLGGHGSRPSSDSGSARLLGSWSVEDGTGPLGMARGMLGADASRPMACI
jgi:hypothetical protein